MHLIDRFADIFQLSYVTANWEAALDLAKRKFGVEEFFCFEGRSPVICRGESVELNLRVAVCNTGAHQLEIIEPVSGPTWIYTDGMDLKNRVMTLHHVGVAVVGPLSVWADTVCQLMEQGDEIVQMSALPEHGDPQAMFAYVDNRATLGHYTEYLWWSETMNGKPTFPNIVQG